MGRVEHSDGKEVAWLIYPSLLSRGALQWRRNVFQHRTTGSHCPLARVSSREETYTASSTVERKRLISQTWKCYSLDVALSKLFNLDILQSGHYSIEIMIVPSSQSCCKR